MKEKLKFYYRCAKWLFKNRERPDNRNKFRAMMREVEK